MNKQLIENILRKAKTARIAVVGDFFLDVTWSVDESSNENALESDMPTWAIEKQAYSLGGAGNVVKKIQSLGCDQIHAYGIIGNDLWGTKLKKTLKETGINCAGLKTQENNWATNTSVKSNNAQIELNRIEFGSFNKLDPETSSSLLAILEKELKDLDLVLIYQQSENSIFTQDFIEQLNSLIDKYCKKTFIVESRHHSDSFSGANIKINDHEAVRLADLSVPEEAIVPREQSLNAVTILANKFNKSLIITRGLRGCIVATEDGIDEIPGIETPGKIDTVGAGESMLAGISVALATGQDAVSSAMFGNIAAAVTMQKPFQTGTASPEEIIKLGSDPNYVLRPELAEDPRKARYLNKTDFEIISTIREAFHANHIIFDHDGTISVLREGWERFMEQTMIRAVLGEQYESASVTLFQQAIDQIRFYIDKTTGVQTLVQMVGLVEMVRDFGCVPENEIKDEFGYKEIYNDALMEMVNERVEKYRKGELGRDDFLIKNAYPLLEYLSKKGVKLYLASGTDQDDVIAEATALGYADFFEGRIYGAVGDVTVEVKRQVMDRIISDVGEGVNQGLVAIGDGPVEMREAKKRGGLSIGIASDEIRRYGLNLKKRKRLIQAGADIIIPDFSQLDAFLNLLGV